METSKEPTSFEAVVERFLDDLRSGRSPRVSDFQLEFPNLSQKIASHLPGLELAEKLRVQQAGPLADIELPYRIGKFLLNEKIGQGGMATVFSAEHIELNLDYAVKLIDMKAATESQKNRFKRKAQIVAQLHHPGIAPIADFGKHKDFFYLAMKKIDGVTFRQLVTQPENLENLNCLNKNERSVSDDWNLLAILFKKVADVLTFIHDNGLVHRDIKPSNLMVDKDSRVWVTDFGLVQQIDDGTLISSSSLAGTPSYIAPECYDGILDYRADIYGLGVTMFELTTRVTAASIVDAGIEAVDSGFGANRKNGLPLAHEIRPTVPVKLSKIIERACNVQPSKRHSSCKELANDLRKFVISNSQTTNWFGWIADSIRK